MAVAPLSYGVFSEGRRHPRVGVRTGVHVLDLSVLARRGLLDAVPRAADVFAAASLNPFMALGPEVWRAFRVQLEELLGNALHVPDALVPLDRAVMHLPIEVGDFVDFYSSRDHAANGGRIMRPDSDPLPPNWSHLPVGYHGRSSSIVVSGTEIRRPRGQTRNGGDAPRFEPSRKLDFELELGFVIGVPSAAHTAIPVARALDHVFGLVLLNDWSARDLQAWEAKPLGPFLAKAFATSISAWVTPLDALHGRRVPPADPQDPEPLAHLRGEPLAFDLDLEVVLRPANAGPDAVVSRTSARHLYWSVEQQIAHLTSGGARLRTGDLLGSGAISGPARETRGSLLELTWDGSEPIVLADGSERRYLEDGDEVILRSDGLAECRGRVIPA